MFSVLLSVLTFKLLDWNIGGKKEKKENIKLQVWKETYKLLIFFIRIYFSLGIRPFEKKITASYYFWITKKCFIFEKVTIYEYVYFTRGQIYFQTTFTFPIVRQQQTLMNFKLFRSKFYHKAYQTAEYFKKTFNFWGHMRF